MANLLSQDDLNALWEQPAGEGADPQKTGDGEGAGGAGISQADLDNLYAGLSALQNGQADAPKQAEETDGAGISQADLDKLWGAVAAADKAEAPPAPEPKAAPIGENLSQDDIDRLLADFGR